MGEEHIFNGEGKPCEIFCKVTVTTELYVTKCVTLYCTLNGSQKGSCDKVQVLETLF